MVIISNYRMTLQILSMTRKYNNHRTYFTCTCCSIHLVLVEPAPSNELAASRMKADQAWQSYSFGCAKFIIGVSVGNWIHKQFPAAQIHTL